MLNALCKKIVPGWDSPYDPRTRERGGNAASIVGVFVNLVLFAGKFIAGVLSASIALQADAFNNLSDAGSSVNFAPQLQAGEPPCGRGASVRPCAIRISGQHGRGGADTAAGL